MIIENKNNAGKAKLAYLLTPFFYIVIIGSLAVAEKISNLYAPVIITLLFIGIIVFFSWLKFYYVQFIFENQILKIKYFSISPTSGHKRIVEVPFQNLEKFEIKKRLFNLKKELFIYQKTKKGVAKYPPISITLFSRKDYQELLKNLNQIIGQ